MEKKRFFGDETPTISSPSIPPTTIKVSSSNGNDDGIDGNDDGGVDADSTDESEVTGEQGGDPLDITVHTPKSSFEGKGMNLSPTSAGLGNVVDVEGSVIVKGISNPNPNPLKDNGERALRAPLQRNGSVVDLTSIPLEVLDADNSPENSESELSGLTLSDDNDGNYCSTMPLKPSTSTKPEKGESDKEKKSSSGSNNSGAVHDDGQEMVMTVSRSSKKDGEGLEILKSEGSITVPPVLYRHSFISHRCSEDRTIKGPEAVFGRHGVSIMMTRSLGDKFGPRSCVSIPEVAYATVQPGQFVCIFSHITTTLLLTATIVMIIILTHTLLSLLTLIVPSPSLALSLPLGSIYRGLRRVLGRSYLRDGAHLCFQEQVQGPLSVGFPSSGQGQAIPQQVGLAYGRHHCDCSGYQPSGARTGE